MKTLSPVDVISHLQWRYAVKKFDASKKVSTVDWQAIEESMVLTPSSYGLQPWKFIVVTNPEVKQSLVPHSWGQTQAADCSHLVVFAARTDLNEADLDRYLARISEVRGTPVESLGGFKKMMAGGLLNPQFQVNSWAANQCYIALGQLMAICATMGIDTCPMEGFVPAKYDEILGITAMGYHSVVCCPVGYRAEDDKYAVAPKVRYKLSDVVVHI